jgi:hypothetical protein
MFHKMALVLVATAALGAVALSPTSASAGGYGHHWGGHGWGWGGFGVGVAAGIVGGAIVANTCVQREVVATPYGPVVRWVIVCY